MRDSNVTAWRAGYAGLGIDGSRTVGSASRSVLLTSAVQLEGAVTDADARSGYGRATLQLALSRSVGAIAGALHVSGGSSLGPLPPQRMWYLGGTQTLPGLSFGTAGGDGEAVEHARQPFTGMPTSWGASAAAAVIASL